MPSPSVLAAAVGAAARPGRGSARGTTEQTANRWTQLFGFSRARDERRVSDDPDQATCHRRDATIRMAVKGRDNIVRIMNSRQQARPAGLGEPGGRTGIDQPIDAVGRVRSMSPSPRPGRCPGRLIVRRLTDASVGPGA